VSLPDPIAEYIQRRSYERQKPFCMRISEDMTLLESWGDAKVFGLESLHSGADVTQAIPVLCDYDFDARIVLPFVTDNRNFSYHVHIVPDSGQRYVLLIDAREELEQRRRYQQAANEVRLALEKEQKFIAELVDAQAELALRRKEAEQESRRRGEYIATMSHEFRTPLTAIITRAERLSEHALKAEDKESAQAIAGIAHRQLWVIDNLLARAKLDAEGFVVHAGVTDVRRLVDELSLVFAPLAAEKALSFSAFVAHSVPEFVWLDGFHLRQVLVNVLGNAIKYTREGSVVLRLEYRDCRLYAAVADTGPGMDEDSLRTVFAPFVRGREAPNAPGAGLGLGISRQLVEAMGAELTIDSALNRGTTVSFDLAADAVSRSRADSDFSRSQRLIVCDDDPDITDLLDVRLREAGYDVRIASDGESLIDLALETDPQAIIVDLNMPGVDGPAAARRLRESGFRAPIIVLSGAGSSRDFEYALAAGCTQFVRKPPQMAALIRLIEESVLAAQVESSRDVDA
jgi:signal transduction histidine kinase/CheY-like chemotaxis protein